MRIHLASIAPLATTIGFCGVLAGCAAEPVGPDRVLLEVEDARPVDAAALLAELSSHDAALQRLAVRALGRLERPEFGTEVLALAGSAYASVRREVANAIGQMGGSVDLSEWLARETDGDVRAAIYRAIGRMTPIADVTEPALVAGLGDSDPAARRGAAHGLEAFIRLNARTLPPASETVAALRQAVRDNPGPEMRELALLALAAAGDRDPDTLDLALGDPDPQVRRLAVMGLGTWVDDADPMVRYEALRLDATCDRALAALDDDSGHVALLAADLLGTLSCPAGAIELLVADDQPWRMRAHGLVSLARVAPAAARRHLPALASDPVWQARAYAARAARLLDAEDVRVRLASDPEPNVVIAAMTEADEAIRALDSSHRGLLMAAADLLEGSPELGRAAPSLTTAFLRLSGEDRATSRDARVALLARLEEAPLDDGGLLAVTASLRPWLSDRDPVVAARVAEVIATLAGEAVEPITRTYADDALPDDDYLSGLAGATADITMADVGTFTIELLTDEAPVTVGKFARHAEGGGYDGTTFHRVVPNFVLQGGSPGAHEMDGAVGPFMRDELGLERHLRGTLGISTRGRDTGDGQIFVNLVDNFRLDHNYTVWARVITGMNVVDRILEGDVIERVTIRRR